MCNSREVAIVIITSAVTFILTLTTTAIVTFIVTYYVCVKRKFKNVYNSNKQSSPEKLVYEQVGPSSRIVSKNDLELQQNPAYATSHKVVMDTNPAYESCQ